MSVNKAIDILKGLKFMFNCTADVCAALDIAIKALEDYEKP